MAEPSLTDVGKWSRAAWTWAGLAALSTLVFFCFAGLGWLLGIVFAAIAFATVGWVYYGKAPDLMRKPAAATGAPEPAPAPAVAAPAATAAPAPVATPEPEPTPEPAPAPVPAASTVAEATPEAAEPVTPAPAPAEPAAAVDNEPAVQKAVASMPEVDMEAAQAAATARVRSAAQAAGELARLAAAPVAVARPAGIDGPRNDRGDDLKKIKGVGPKLEAMLQRLGFWHFDQIASWTPAELAWVDANLDAFNGRASREDWVGQCKVLAAGGETEHSRAVERGEHGSEHGGD